MLQESVKRTKSVIDEHRYDTLKIDDPSKGDLGTLAIVDLLWELIFFFFKGQSSIEVAWECEL